MTIKLTCILIGIWINSSLHKPLYNHLVWSDEFENTQTLDLSKWRYDLGDGCPELCGWGNNEMQIYTNSPTNVRVENGRLILEAHATDSNNYTSAKLVSINDGDWLYGRIEVKAKLPKGTGTWPAIWMLPTNNQYGTWPKSGEIDIMEHVGFDYGKIHGTVHTENFNHLKGTQKGKVIELPDPSEEFHVYAIEWDEKGIAFYVDDIQYNYFKNTQNGFEEWPFNHSFQLILNVAVGGNWGGREGVDTSIWPQRMEIDFVRVYQL